MIFTSRCETQRFLMEHLTADLGLRAAAVVGLGGAMPDVEQTRVVEQFTQENEAMRILVATKVASEGLNLHYLQPPAGVLRRSRSSGSRSQSRGLAHTSPPGRSGHAGVPAGTQAHVGALVGLKPSADVRQAEQIVANIPLSPASVRPSIARQVKTMRPRDLFSASPMPQEASTWKRLSRADRDPFSRQNLHIRRLPLQGSFRERASILAMILSVGVRTGVGRQECVGRRGSPNSAHCSKFMGVT